MASKGCEGARSTGTTHGKGECIFCTSYPAALIDEHAVRRHHEGHCL
jgi:hypothetical protein